MSIRIANKSLTRQNFLPQVPGLLSRKEVPGIFLCLKMTRKVWSISEITFLKENYHKNNLDYLVKNLTRWSKKQILIKAGHFALKRNDKKQSYIIKDNLLYIDLSTKKHPNKFAIVDVQMHEKVNSRKWWLSKSGYVYSREHKKQDLLLHRLVLEAKDGEIIDHIDRNPLNNTKANLRICTQQQNSCNTSIRLDNTSGYKGVSFHKAKQKWRADITYKGKRQNLGYFLNKEDASLAYKQASLKLHSEFSTFTEALRVGKTSEEALAIINLTYLKNV